MAQKADPNSSHMAGEHFVAAELYKRGYSVGMTIGNAKAIDLYAGKGKHTVPVQVKAIRNRASAGWPIWKSEVVEGALYVFVCLNDPGQPPDYFVLTPRETRSEITEYSTRAIIGLSQLKNSRFKERWDKLGKTLQKGA